MPSFYILGQSNHGVSILLDCLHSLYPIGTLDVEIIANLPAEQNDSLPYAFETPGIGTTVRFHTDWQPEEGVPCLMGSIGKGRKAIFDFFKQSFQIEEECYFNTIHPSSVVAVTARLGRGVHVSPLSVVSPFAHLGDFVIVNRNASVGHHTTLGNFVSVNPGANVAGVCNISDHVTIGAGATVIDRISIGEGSIIGAGSVVTRDIPAGVVAYGNPAKVIREVGTRP